MSAATHYLCDVEHPSRKGRASPGNHSPGCPVAEGHTAGIAAGPQCKACMHGYQLKSYRKRIRVPKRNPNHPHYNCLIPREDHPIRPSVGQDHRAGCQVAEGHLAGVSAGSKSGCSACKREINRRGYRTGVLRRKYKMTVSEYDRLFEVQGGRCAICGKSQEIKLAVDHDHQTGRNRGLLCKKCNVGLGYFFDDTTALRAAISYLKR